MIRVTSLIFAVLIIFCNTKNNEINKTEELYKIKRETVVGTGPNNEKASTIETLEKILSKENLSNLNDKKHSIIIGMHDVENDWSQSVLLGIKNTLSKNNLKIDLITDGEFNIKKQISDYKQIKKLKPDVLITLSIDAQKTSKILLEIEKQGTKIIFIDALPNGFKAGENCVGWAVGDCYTMGKAGGELILDKFGNNKKIVMLNWKNKMFTVDRRSEGAKKALEKVNVKEIEFESFHEIENLIEEIIKKEKDISAFWAVWDTPALEILKVLKKYDYPAMIVTADLSGELANELSIKDSKILGTIVDDPFTIGKIEGLLTIAALLKIEVPSYYVTPVIKVTSENLKEAWYSIYRENLSSEILANLKSREL